MVGLAGLAGLGEVKDQEEGGAGEIGDEVGEEEGGTDGAVEETDGDGEGGGVEAFGGSGEGEKAQCGEDRGLDSGEPAVLKEDARVTEEEWDQVEAL